MDEYHPCVAGAAYLPGGETPEWGGKPDLFKRNIIGTRWVARIRVLIETHPISHRQGALYRYVFAYGLVAIDL